MSSFNFELMYDHIREINTLYYERRESPYKVLSFNFSIIHSLTKGEAKMIRVIAVGKCVGGRVIFTKVREAGYYETLC